MEPITRTSTAHLAILPPLAGRDGSTRNVAAILLGCRLLTKMLAKRRLSLTIMPQSLLALLLARHGVRTLETLYEEVGTGKLPASAVVGTLLELVTAAGG